MNFRYEALIIAALVAGLASNYSIRESFSSEISIPQSALAQTQFWRVYDSGIGTLASQLNLGVETSHQERDWVKQESDKSMCAHYPPGQNWGAVFFVYEDFYSPGNRPGIDLSGYTNLVIEMKGEQGGELVSIGLKDSLDPDNGSEAKIRQELTSNYQTYSFPLSAFYTANLEDLYIVTEFVFEAGSPSQKICWKNIEFRR